MSKQNVANKNVKEFADGAGSGPKGRGGAGNSPGGCTFRQRGCNRTQASPHHKSEIVVSSFRFGVVEDFVTTQGR